LSTIPRGEGLTSAFGCYRLVLPEGSWVDTNAYAALFAMGAVVSIRHLTYRELQVRLSRSDLEGALDFLSQAGELSEPESFPPEMLGLLATLIRCEGVNYCEIDRVRRTTIVSACNIDVDDGDEEEAAYWTTVEEHPIRRHRALTGELGAFKLYDFATPRQLRRTRFYADYLRHSSAPRGFLMSVSLPAPQGITCTFLVDRESVDFGERERSLLNLLQPHLSHLRSAVEARRRARATNRGMPDGILSERETDVLQHVAEGMRNREIAQALWIAPGTVRKHLDNIYAKLGVHSRAAATARLRQDPSAS
jgi:DNA-binding CsgD family transcriptional regulator